MSTKSWTVGWTSTGVIEEFAFPADPHPDHPFFTGPAIIDGQVLLIAKGFIDPNGPTGRLMSDDAHRISEDRLDCHAIPVLGECQASCAQIDREELVRTKIEPHLKRYFAGTHFLDGPSRLVERIKDPLGFRSGGPYGAVVRFKSDGWFRYDLVKFHLSDDVNSESLEEALVLTDYEHEIIHEHQCA